MQRFRSLKTSWILAFLGITMLEKKSTFEFAFRYAVKD